MRDQRPSTQTVLSAALWPLIIGFSPVIVLAGEPISRYVMGRALRGTAEAQGAADRQGPARAILVQPPLTASLLLAAISNPLWIALTAPGRWVSDRFRRHPDGPADR